MAQALSDVSDLVLQKAERVLRVELAAAYRLVDYFGLIPLTETKT